MKKMFFIFFLLSSVILNAQSISGDWYGWANFDDHPDENNYMISLSLKQRGEEVQGSMSVYYMDELRTFPIYGLLDSNAQTFLITHLDIPVHFFGLEKFGKVDIDMLLSSKVINSRSGSQLKGYLFSKTYRNISNINFVLFRPVEVAEITNYFSTENKAIPGKKVIIQEEIMVYDDTVYVSLYDGAIIDGDTVSVFLNGSKVVDRQLLGLSPISFSFELKSLGASVYLTLQAENLGSIPPNTGVMIVSFGETRKTVHFSNSLSLSSAWLFTKGAR